MTVFMPSQPTPLPYSSIVPNISADDRLSIYTLTRSIALNKIYGDGKADHPASKTKEAIDSELSAIFEQTGEESFFGAAIMYISANNGRATFNEISWGCGGLVSDSFCTNHMMREAFRNTGVYVGVFYLSKKDNPGDCEAALTLIRDANRYGAMMVSNLS
jgi:hypothetical protein